MGKILGSVNTEAGVNTPSPGVGNTIGTVDTSQVGDKVKDVAGDVTEEVIDALLTKGFKWSDSADAGAAFAYALADGWTLGVLDLVMGAVGLGDELDELRKRNPTVSTAGDIASFISPGLAVKLWVAATRVGAKALAKVLTRAQFSANESTRKRIIKAFDEFLKKGTRPAGEGLDVFIAKTLKMSNAQAKAFIKKHGITGGVVYDDVIRGVYGGIPQIAKHAAKYARAAKAARNADKSIDKALKTLEKLNIDLTDAVQVVMTYNHIHTYYTDRGATESEALSLIHI